jgi:polyisoprenoid-binding protein YceI
MKKIVLALMMLMSAWGIQAQTGKWVNDAAHTRIGFEISHAGLSLVSGRFTDFDIDVDAAGKNLLDTKIVATIKTNSVKTGIEARDNHLKTADFFEVDNYPTMVFKSTRISAKTKNTGKIYGTLTIRDVTKPVVLDATLIAKKVSPMSKVLTAGFRLKGKIKRSDFNFGPKYLPEIIGNDVTIIIDGEFSPASK